ncbi:MAG: hypothetical protein FD187_3038 [bacterium]|nr:MAG: hypothetical protein FD142_3014 [bacterium]KAF0147137.1 MAG: hypothetical protein FD187_3038 [bacterium]KAF0165112.1 MAG: hypothetical protein FD158_2963 [bacterium]TXT22834.1 MAG: hypothetical protein FD132_212 [bacterium]
MFEGRLANALEGVAFALMVLVLFYFVAFLVKRILNKSIASPRYYVITVVAGFLLHRVLVAVLSGPPSEPGADISVSPVVATAAETAELDKPFIPPKEAELEKFPLQLKQSIDALSAKDREQANEAIAFLTFALFADLLEKNSTAIDRLEESDIAAKSLTNLYRFAQKNGSSMTLRKYIDLAEEFKRQKPEWWRKYTEASKVK